MNAPRVVAISDLATVDEETLCARLDAVAEGLDGALWVLVRDYGLSPERRRNLATRLRKRTEKIGARLLVGVDVALALEVFADGVHLPGRLAEDVAAVRGRFTAKGRVALVSIACHSVDEIVVARERGVDLALLSPIFASPGKGTPLGVGALGAARRALLATDASRAGAALPAIPALIALGGVDEENARACLKAGADGVAAIRAAPASLLSALESVGTCA